MKLNTFLFAEAASAHDGLLYIHRGGLTRLHAPVLPWTQPQLGVVIRFEVVPEDVGREFKVSFALRAPEGGVVVPHTVFPARIAEPSTVPGESFFFQAALTISPLVFTAYGAHTFELEVDGEPVHRGVLAVTDVAGPDQGEELVPERHGPGA